MSIYEEVRNVGDLERENDHMTLGGKACVRSVTLEKKGYVFKWNFVESIMMFRIALEEISFYSCMY